MRVRSKELTCLDSISRARRVTGQNATSSRFAGRRSFAARLTRRERRGLSIATPGGTGLK